MAAGLDDEVVIADGFVSCSSPNRAFSLADVQAPSVVDPDLL